MTFIAERKPVTSLRGDPVPLWADGESRILGLGDFGYVPPGTVHSFQLRGTTRPSSDRSGRVGPLLQPYGRGVGLRRLPAGSQKAAAVREVRTRRSRSR